METQRICPNCRKPLPPDVPLGLCPECLIKSGFPTEGGPGVSGEAVGARFVPPPVEEIARLFPQLEILGFIGKGGMGAVYKARQPTLDRLVALKVLPPAVASDSGFAERFTREARALARLSHPSIVGVYDFGKVGQASRLPDEHAGASESGAGVPPASSVESRRQNARAITEAGEMPALHYLLMEFVDGTNLREIERAGKMAPEQALSIVPKICEALQYAHDQGVVHRDIKPENILLDKQGRVKIADFGIAKMVGGRAGSPLPADVAQTDGGAHGVTRPTAALTEAGQTIGTPHYMAPEQIEKPQTVDRRADIYSLGVVFYEMLTGELPLGKFAPPSKKVQVDVRLDEVVLRTLEKEPERRYQQASVLKTEVETIAATSGSGRSQREEAQTERASKKSGMVRIGEILFGINNFKSPLAIKLVNASALGFLGFLGFLKDLPFPGSHYFVGCFGFTGFFGLIGLACLVEMFARQRDLSTAQRRFALVVRRGEKAVVHWPGVLLCLAIALAVGEMFTVIGSAIILNGIPPLPLFTVFCSVLAAVIAMVISKKVFTPLEKLMPLEEPPVQKPDHFWRRLMLTLILVPLGLFLVAALLVFVSYLSASVHTPQSNATVNGIVTDATTGKPIGGARVDDNRYGADTDKPPAQAWTDRNGHYELNTRYEEHTIAASAPGYETKLSLFRTKPFGSERNVRMNFKLQPLHPAPATTPLTPQWQLLPANSNVSASPSPSSSTSKTTSTPSPPKPPIPLIAPVPSVGPVSLEPSVTAAVQIPPSPKTAVIVNRPPIHPQKILRPLSTTDPFQQKFSRTLPLSANGRLSLDNVNGRIEIAGWDRNEVSIRALKHGKTQESVEATKIKIDSSPDKITIHTVKPPDEAGFSWSWLWSDGWKRNEANVDYAIQVPQNARLKSISNVNGHIIIEDVSGDIEASAVNGETQVTGAAGNLKLSTVNGRMEVELNSLDKGQTISLSTVNGQIEAILPCNANAKVSASTINGGVSSEFPELMAKREFPVGNKLKGRLGHGGATVTASSVNGRINFRRSKD